MKNILFIFLFLTGSYLYAQNVENRFEQTDKNSQEFSSQNTEPETLGGDPGNPGGGDDPPPVPIDEYLPLLLLSAVGIIAYTTHKTHRKRNLLS